MLRALGFRVLGSGWVLRADNASLKPILHLIQNFSFELRILVLQTQRIKNLYIFLSRGIL